MIVLVCGGRNYSDLKKIHETLNPIKKEIDLLIQGGAIGADRLALYWARTNDINEKTFPADWIQYGKAAGHIRNKQMLLQGKPDLVIAFPGGRGTADMVKQAREANIEVREIM